MKSRFATVRTGVRRGRGAMLLAALCLMALGRAQAELQFDVFLGYDGIIPEGSWFPAVCEIKNDGPAFNGTVEIQGENYNPGPTRLATVELPTGTLKRIVIPIFSSSRNFGSWNARLLDEHGKVRKEQPSLRARKQVAAATPLMGALSRTASGAPTIEPTRSTHSELQPVAARLLPTIFPDNPLALEGMSALYLNSEKAVELREANQVGALRAWLQDGGHLIVGVEQISDITSTPWLRAVFPCDLKDIRPVRSHPGLQRWLREAVAQTNALAAANQNPNYQVPGQHKKKPVANVALSDPEYPFKDLADDMTFEAAEMQVAVGSVRDGSVVVSADDKPLIVTATRGKGRVTALLFSPEREPFRSWKHAPVFWARLAEVPAAWYASSDVNVQGGWGSDGLIGALIDSRQIHKLPVEWLLLLLIVYLVVIGPFDQFWLKRIGKPMLTWVTFPCYVVCFSLLIYFIGYRLRAGESEWNELHLVDVLAHGGEDADLRGRTFASIYSPANQKYNLQSNERYAMLRGEFIGSWGSGQTSERGTVVQNGDGFKAEIFVPVWTSQLLVNDWLQQSSGSPLKVTVSPAGDGWEVEVNNRTDQKLSNVQLAVEDRLIPLGDMAANQMKKFLVNRNQGISIAEFVSKYGDNFMEVVQARQQAFGGRGSGNLEDSANTSMAISFLSHLQHQQNYMNFLTPPGLDLSPVVEHGDAVLLAFAKDYAPTKGMNQFSPKRIHRDTLWRVPVPLKGT